MTTIYEAIRRLDSNKALNELRAVRIDMARICTWLADAEGGRRLDAGETANLARALLYLRAQSIDVEYHTGQFRQVLGVNSGVPLGATSYGIPQFDRVGEAEFISSYSDDLKRADVQQSENTIKIQAFGLSYEYSVQDLLSAAMSGVPLDQKRQQAVRDAMDAKHDKICCLGDTTHGLTGFAKNSSVDVVSLANAGTWATKAAANEGWKILADIAALLRNITSDTLGMHRGDRIAMPSTQLEIVNTTVMSTTDARTVRRALSEGGYASVELVEWERLRTADAQDDGPRIVGFHNDNNVVEYIAPGGGYTEQPPQEKNLAFVVNSWGRTAGCALYRPKAASYMDVG
jgi:hypothetical protein